MQIIYAPENIIEGNSIFLGGSIEMGKAEDWQHYAVAFIDIHTSGKDIIIYNPRRKDWDPSWVQSKDNPKFREQVEWEREALEKCTHILMHLEPGTMSPISLMEIGEHCRSSKMVVVCSNKFYRKGNVDILCEYYNIPLYTQLSDGINHILNKLT